MPKEKLMKPMLVVGPDWLEFDTINAYAKVIKESWGDKYPFVLVSGWDNKWRVLGPFSWLQLRAKKLLKKTIEHADFLGRYNFFSQHEQSVLITALKFHRKRIYGDIDIKSAMDETAENLIKEFENVPCNCGTCRVARRDEKK